MARRARAWCSPAPRRIELVAEPVDAPPPGQALVRTLTSAISAGTELLAFRGQLAPDTPLDETLGALGRATFAFPFRYGYASVGEVVAVGEGVEPAWIGRRVFALPAARDDVRGAGRGSPARARGSGRRSGPRCSPTWRRRST